MAVDESDESPDLIANDVMVRSNLREAIHQYTGMKVTDEDWQQLKVLLRALGKFHERDAKHRGLWRYFGAIDSGFQARAKATRTYNVAIGLLKDPESVLGMTVDGRRDDPLDDAIDMINYACFFVRNVEEGRYG